MDLLCISEEVLEGCTRGFAYIGDFTTILSANKYSIDLRYITNKMETTLFEFLPFKENKQLSVTKILSFGMLSLATNYAAEAVPSPVHTSVHTSLLADASSLADTSSLADSSLDTLSPQISPYRPVLTKDSPRR